MDMQPPPAVLLPLLTDSEPFKRVHLYQVILMATDSSKPCCKTDPYLCPEVTCFIVWFGGISSPTIRPQQITPCIVQHTQTLHRKNMAVIYQSNFPLSDITIYIWGCVKRNRLRELVLVQRVQLMSGTDA